MLSGQLSAYLIFHFIKSILFSEPAAPKVVLQILDNAESDDVLIGRKKLDPSTASPLDPSRPHEIRCWDPCTMDDLGTVKAFTAEEVKQAVALSRAAQQTWRASSFAQRRHLLRTIQRCIADNIHTIVRVACRDSGKTKIDAYMGEVLVTCEKIRWLCAQGERWLGPEYRDSGLLNLLKTSRVEFVPVGVVGAIVPWNCAPRLPPLASRPALAPWPPAPRPGQCRLFLGGRGGGVGVWGVAGWGWRSRRGWVRGGGGGGGADPFHNVFNPLVAAVFAGNGIVVKTSEYASWSTGLYGRMIK